MSDAYIIKRGGGEGSYAIIKILYDEGESVIVEHNGETYEAPDTSGIWMFGCEENGTYICSLIDALIPQSTTITITEKGQVEFVNLESQIVNYLDLYLYGNEQNGLTGGYNEPKSSGVGTFTSNNVVDLRDYTGFYVLHKVEGCDSVARTCSVSLQIVPNTSNYTNISSITSPATHPTLNIIRKVAYYKNTTGYTINKNINIKLALAGSTESYTTNVYKNSNNFIVNVVKITPYNQYDTDNLMYGLGATKNDDISIMSAYGSTISDILVNSANLFNDELTLQKMVKTCTGDFMFSALGNSNFVSAMNSSDNKTILLANEHWSKFISFLSI